VQLIYEGKDITHDVEIRTANLIDCAGEKFDSILLELNNPTNEWSGWKPQKHQSIELKEGNFPSGKMFTYIVRQQSGLIVLKAIPTKKVSKERHTKSWENVTLFELLKEFSSKHGLGLKTYNIQDYIYKRVNQIDEADFKFLNKRCMLEGYVLKISDGHLIVFNETHMESQSGITINAVDVLGDFKFYAQDVYGSVRMISGSIDFIFTLADGPVLTVEDIEVNSIGEAERFSKNILRSTNKYESTLVFDTQLNTAIAAGSTVNIQGLGLSDGKYYIYQVMDQFANNRTTFYLRRL
jgi:hypothetical protein